MNEKIKKMTSEMKYNKPTTKVELEKLESEFSIILPNDYKNFMLATNGAEGSIGEVSYLAIFDIEEIDFMNKEFPLKENFPELFFFASDRGGYEFAFDTRTMPMKIVKVDDYALHYDEIEQIADTFEKFIECEYMVNY